MICYQCKKCDAAKAGLNQNMEEFCESSACTNFSVAIGTAGIKKEKKYIYICIYIYQT